MCIIVIRVSQIQNGGELDLFIMIGVWLVRQCRKCVSLNQYWMVLRIRLALSQNKAKCAPMIQDNVKWFRLFMKIIWWPLGVLTYNDLIFVLIKILIRSAPRPCSGMCTSFAYFPFMSSNQKWKRSRLKSFGDLSKLSQSRHCPRYGLWKLWVNRVK